MSSHCRPPKPEPKPCPPEPKPCPPKPEPPQPEPCDHSCYKWLAIGAAVAIGFKVLYNCKQEEDCCCDACSCQ